MPTEEVKVVVKQEDQTQGASRSQKRGVDEYNRSLNQTIRLKDKLLQQERQLARERESEQRAMRQVARSQRVTQRPGRRWTAPEGFMEMSKADLIRGVASGQIPMTEVPQELRNEIQVERQLHQRQQRRVVQQQIQQREGGGGGGGGGGRLGWARFLRGGRGAVTGTLGAMTGGVEGFAGGMGQVGSAIGGAGMMLGGAAGAALGVGAALVGILAATTAMAANMAGPAFSYQNVAMPLNYRLGRNAVAEARAIGMQYGYSPEESARLQAGLERGGAQAGFGAAAKLRWAGIEAQEATQLMTGATGAGIVQPGKSTEYERFAKIIAIAIADKTKLPSVPQYLEQLNNLMSLSNQFQADIGITGGETLAAIAKWQETAGTSMLRGTQGARTMASIANWVGKTEDPAQQVMIYEALKGDSRFQQESARILREKGISIGPGEDWWKFEYQREMPEAWIPALSGFSRRFGGNKNVGAAVLRRGTGLSMTQARMLIDISEKHGGDYGKIKEEFQARTKEDLEKLVQPMDEGDLRRKLAEIAEKQLQAAEALAPDVAELKDSLAELRRLAIPILKDAVIITKWTVNWINSNPLHKATPEEKKIMEEADRNSPFLPGVGG